MLRFALDGDDRLDRLQLLEEIPRGARALGLEHDLARAFLHLQLALDQRPTQRTQKVRHPPVRGQRLRHVMVGDLTSHPSVSPEWAHSLSQPATADTSEASGAGGWRASGSFLFGRDGDFGEGA